MKVNDSVVAILRGITASKDGPGFRKWIKSGLLELWSKVDLHDGDACKLQMLQKSSGPYLMTFEVSKEMTPTHVLMVHHHEGETIPLSGTKLLSQREGDFLALAKLGKAYLQLGDVVFVFDAAGQMVAFGSPEDYEVALKVGEIEPAEIAERDPFSEVRMHYARTSGMGSYTRYSVIGPDGKEISPHRFEGGKIGDAIWRWGDVKEALMIRWNGSNSGIQRHGISYCPPHPTPEQAKWFREQYEKHRTDHGYIFQNVPEQLKRAMEKLNG